MKNYILSGNRLVLLTLAVLATLIMAYVIISSGNHAQAQESVIATPELTSTAKPDDGMALENKTVAVEICSIDRATGEESCRKELRPAGNVTPRSLPPDVGRTKRGAAPGGCHNDLGNEQVCSEGLVESGLLSTLRITGTNDYASDTFNVEADFLSRNHTYKLRVRRESANFDIGFDITCADRQETIDVPRAAHDYYAYDDDFTLYGCSEDGGTVTIELLKDNEVTLTLEKDVTVEDERPTERPTATPTSTSTSTPTPTPTPTSAPEYPDPPRNLVLSEDDDDDNGLVLDYDRSESPHFYEFELHVSNTRYGSYDDIDTEDSDEPDVEFDHLEQGQYYKAQGRNCLDRRRTQCGENWSGWSNTKYLSITPYVHAYNNPVHFQADEQWHPFHVVADPNIRLKILANPTGAPVLFVMSESNPGRADLCHTKRQNQSFTRVYSGFNIWIAACAEGTGTIQVQRFSNGEILNTQTFRVSSRAAPSPTPTATATSTAVPTPTPSDCDLPSLNIVGGRANTITRQWDTDCTSEKQAGAGIGDRYAKFYTFTLGVTSNVTINLSSSIDPFLYLMRGAGTSNAVLYENDDIVYGVDLNSRIVADLAPGTYTIEATTYGTNVGNGSEFTLSVEATPISADCSASTLRGFTSVEVRSTGEWTNTCITPTNSTHPGFSRYYGFTLPSRSTVYIDVEAPSGNSPEVFIARSGSTTAAREGTQFGSRQTQFIEDVDAGNYTIEVTWPNDLAESLYSGLTRSGFTLKMRTYVLGTRPASGSLRPSESTHRLITGDHFTSRIVQAYTDFSPYGVTFGDETRLYLRTYEGCLDMRRLNVNPGSSGEIMSGTNITPPQCPPEFGNPLEKPYRWFWFEHNTPRFLHGPAYPNKEATTYQVIAEVQNAFTTLGAPYTIGWEARFPKDPLDGDVDLFCLNCEQ